MIKARGINIYNPLAKEPFLLSRYKIELFLECPRCFYLDCRLGISRPSGFPLTLNNAVDKLLKKEFDIHRAKKEAYPLMAQYGIKAIPFDHPEINNWRNNRKGIRYLHKQTNLLIYGAIDDIWIDDIKQLHIVDYKTTSSSKEVTLDDEWKDAYKRQMEIYQWLFKQNGFDISSIGYFVYCNGKTDREAFDGKLEFDISILPYDGNDSWVEPTLYKIKKCLDAKIIPEPAHSCDYCKYVKSVTENSKN